CDDNWNALVFHDAAVMGISESFPAESGQSLQSAGLGLTCSLGERGSARMSYGWELSSEGILEPQSGGTFHFGFVLQY
ncbi:MAG: hypothetical protein AAF491_02090, partial [Verrucomicrobiota bacterium]